VSVVLKRYKKSVKITVEDNGRGIPVADTQRIFDRFYRCDSSRSGSGCGLGLSFARAVARSHGGEIELSHQTKQGAVFTLTLPLAHAQ
jgi:signal transduction histidine kinase